MAKVTIPKRLFQVLHSTSTRRGIVSKNLQPHECPKCGALIISRRLLCDSCANQPRKLQVGTCIIVEAFGRCEEYMQGLCEKCLDIVSGYRDDRHLDWIGWRKIGDTRKDKM